MAYEDTEDYKALTAAAKREKKDYERSQMVDEPGATESLRVAAARMGASKPKSMTPGKPAIVTKEQMQKAGFDNLRDYLNAKQGLKRRDNFASEAQKTAFAAGSRGSQTEGTAGEAAAREAEQERRKKAAISSARPRGGMKAGGMVKSSASKRADGCAVKGKTRGKMV